MAVGIIIPVWNLWENMTLPCLKSLVRHTALSDIHVYLVDNASTDKTASHAEQMGTALFGSGHFTYIRNFENMGFAVACNQGAEQARKDGSEYLLFLNNDTVVTQNWLLPLVRTLENPRVGMAGPLLLYPDKTVQHCGVVFTPMNSVGHIYTYFPPSHYNVLKKRKFRVITGAVLLCRTEQFFALGCFYEGYKNGMEDIDLCYSYAEQGLMQQVVPESIVYHYTSQTPGRLDDDTGLSNGRLLFSRKPHIVPDAHLYYHQDGYVPALTKDFVFYPRLSEEKNKEFNTVVRADYSDDLCREYLAKEPFWYDGYRLLISSLLKQGKAMEAISWNHRLLFYCFSRQNINRFIELAKALNDEKIYRDIERITGEQLAQLDARRQENSKKFAENMHGDSWYDRLLATQELDIDDCGL